jgi:hypothetical protein
MTKANLIAPALTLGLLCAAAAESWSRPRPGDTDPYHARVREAALTIPMNIGSWAGRDLPARKEAIELLKPNVILQRLYTDSKGRHVTVLMVHCRDARDLDGHYPPKCYPGNGREERLSARKACEWSVAGRAFPGTYYEFATAGILGESREIDVYNFLVVPGHLDDGRLTPGAIVPDMDGVTRQAWDYLRRFYGAAQFQVVFTDSGIAPDEQLAIFQEMVQAYMPVIEAIRSGALQ